MPAQPRLVNGLEPLPTLQADASLHTMPGEASTVEGLNNLVEAAWQVRRANWPDVITASLPVDTLPISVTGHSCALNCAHCGGHYLGGMHSLAELGTTGASSLLVSGGCDRAGRVPIRQHLDELRPHLVGRRVNWHLGLVSDDDLAAIAPLGGTVSFDFVGDDETINEVYGLSATADDYERCLERIGRKMRVVPHVTIGLRAGRIGHEWRALERLTRHRFDSLVFLVLVPTAGTAYAQAQPPSLADVAAVMATARLRFPRLSLQLGCMRPAGDYRLKLDELAVRLGANVIVNPTRPARQLAEALGLEWTQQHECCVFNAEPGPAPVAAQADRHMTGGLWRP